VVPEGVAVTEKSAKNTDNEIVPVCPAVVPVTVKFRGSAVLEVRPVTVSTLDCPPEIEAGLKVHVAALLQDSEMEFRNVLGAAAEMVKVAVLEPMSTTLDRALEESVKVGVPVPDNASDVVPFTAFDRTWTLPVTLPVESGEKLTAMVQACPTFSTAGVVGKFPQVLVCPKPVEERMLVMVTA
jgi:hypothetical protein